MPDNHRRVRQALTLCAGFSSLFTLSACAARALSGANPRTPIQLWGEASCVRFDSGRLWCWTQTSALRRYLSLPGAATDPIDLNFDPGDRLAGSPSHFYRMSSEGNVSFYSTFDTSQLQHPMQDVVVTPGATTIESVGVDACSWNTSNEALCWNGHTRQSPWEIQFVSADRFRPIPLIADGNRLRISHIVPYHAAAGLLLILDTDGRLWTPRSHWRWTSATTEPLPDLPDSADTLVELRGHPPLRSLVTNYQNQFCGIDFNETVWCWGSNLGYGLGQLTPGLPYLARTTTQQPNLMPPRRVEIGVGAAAITATLRSFCVLRNDGRVSCWGDSVQHVCGQVNPTSQLGPSNGSWRTNGSPLVLDGLRDVVQLQSSAIHTCALRQNGEVWCWGRNDNRQLGFAAAQDCTDSPRYYRIPVPE